MKPIFSNNQALNCYFDFHYIISSTGELENIALISLHMFARLLSKSIEDDAYQIAAGLKQKVRAIQFS
jgi:hypothetical protein